MSYLLPPRREREHKPTQAQLLLALLRERGDRGVTPLVALDRIGSFRLAARVWDLAQLGHVIETHTVTTDSGARVACYVLVEKKAYEQLGLPL